MEQMARTAKQIASILRRQRRMQGLTQKELGDKIKFRQATISKLETGEAGIQLQTLLDVLMALNLEIVIQPRTKLLSSGMEEIS